MLTSLEILDEAHLGDWFENPWLPLLRISCAIYVRSKSRRIPIESRTFRSIDPSPFPPKKPPSFRSRTNRMTSCLYSSMLSCKRSRHVRVVITRSKYAHFLVLPAFEVTAWRTCGSRVCVRNSRLPPVNYVCLMVLSTTKLFVTNNYTCLRAGDGSGLSHGTHWYTEWWADTKVEWKSIRNNAQKTHINA